MAAKAVKTTTKKASARRTVKPAISRAEKAAYSEIKQGVKNLEKSIAEIQKGLRKAEQSIEADARSRIRELRKDARAQLVALKSKRRDVTRILQNLSAAAGGSWEEVKRSADGILADARATAASVIERFRRSLQR